MSWEVSTVVLNCGGVMTSASHPLLYKATAWIWPHSGDRMSGLGAWKSLQELVVQTQWAGRAGLVPIFMVAWLYVQLASAYPNYT